MTCKHCGRVIVQADGAWIDPEATGDDAIWRETCDEHDTFTAEHEQVSELDELYEAANDHEAATLDELRHRVGQTWECVEGWTNLRADVTCQRCGKPRSDVDADRPEIEADEAQAAIRGDLEESAALDARAEAMERHPVNGGVSE